MAYDGEANAYAIAVPPQIKSGPFKQTVEYTEDPTPGARTRKYSVILI